MKILKTIKWITTDGEKTWQKDDNDFEYAVILDDVEHILSKEQLSILGQMITTITPVPMGWNEDKTKFNDLAAVTPSLETTIIGSQKNAEQL